jgi:2,4-dienoyl-CoA reductase-like NADH-dependent reductase (Old Yellow Enzyme family)
MTSAPIIVNTGFDKTKANTVLANGDADLVAFGVSFLVIPIWSSGCASMRRSTKPIRRPSMASGPRATPIIQRLPISSSTDSSQNA